MERPSSVRGRETNSPWGTGESNLVTEVMETLRRMMHDVEAKAALEANMDGVVTRAYHAKDA